MKSSRALPILCLPFLLALVLKGRDLQPVTLNMTGHSTTADKPLDGNPERGWGRAFPHLSEHGAFEEAGLVAGEIHRSKLPLRNYLRQIPAAGERLSPKGTYLFAYFVRNGEDGLNLASSDDALSWKELLNYRGRIAPKVGNDKLMRDPFILEGADGLFHMVWTVSWREKGIGYASSRDLISWSEQRYLPVMEHEPGALNCWAPEIVFDRATGQYLVFWATTIPGRFPETDRSGDNGWNHRMYSTNRSRANPWVLFSLSRNATKEWPPPTLLTL